MTAESPHPEIGPELRKLAQAILDRLDPAVRAAAAMATESLAGSGRCQQVWCPVCALAALVSGEQHPLLTVIAEHSVALLAVVRAMASEKVPDQNPPDQNPPDQSSRGGKATEAPPASANGTTGSGAGARYERIPIVVEETGRPE